MIILVLFIISLFGINQQALSQASGQTAPGLVRIDSRSAYQLPPGQWYIDGNIMEGHEADSQNNWQSLVELEGEVTMEQARVNQPREVAPVWTQPASEIIDPIDRKSTRL